MAIDKDKIGQVLSESDLKSIEQGLRDIGVSAKDTLSIMTAQRAENERLKKTLEEVKEVQDRINKINLKGNDIIDQTNKIIEARIEKEGKITKWTEDRISNLEYIHKTGNEDLSIAEKRAKIQDRAAQVENDMANSRNKKGQFNKGYNQDMFQARRSPSHSDRFSYYETSPGHQTKCHLAREETGRLSERVVVNLKSYLVANLEGVTNSSSHQCQLKALAHHRAWNQMYR